jgi:hypothetical protein
LNRIFAGVAAVLLFHSVAVAAPHIFKSKPEPIPRVGTLLRERMVAKFGQIMRAPGSYPTAVKIIFLKVQFQNDPAPATSGVSGSGQWNDPIYAYESDPDYWINSAKTHFIDYWKEVSYDKLIISSVTSTNVYTLPHPMSYYGNESNAALENIIYDSVTAAKTDIDFTIYDAILIVHAGLGEESDVLGDTPNDIWSLYYSNSSIAPNASPDAACSNCLSVTGASGAKRITDAIIMPQSDLRINLRLILSGCMFTSSATGSAFLTSTAPRGRIASRTALENGALWETESITPIPHCVPPQARNAYMAVRLRILMPGARCSSAGSRL